MIDTNQYTVETKSANISVADHQIFQVNHHDNYEITFKDIQEIFALYKDYRKKGMVNKMLIIGGGRTSMTSDARQLVQTLIYDTLAEGIVVKSFSERIIANFYFMVKPKAYPIKIFSTEEAAINWLNSL